MTILDFTVEETNLIAIYAEGGGTRADVTARIADALPHMDAEMRDIAARSATKLATMADSDFAAVSFDPALGTDGGE